MISAPGRANCPRLIAVHLVRFGLLLAREFMQCKLHSIMHVIICIRSVVGVVPQNWCTEHRHRVHQLSSPLCARRPPPHTHTPREPQPPVREEWLSLVTTTLRLNAGCSCHTSRTHSHLYRLIGARPPIKPIHIYSIIYRKWSTRLARYNWRKNPFQLNAFLLLSFNRTHTR